jgi:uncharacterized cupin superfamily protein
MTANVFDPHWDAEQDRPPFTWRRSRIGRQAGAEQLGASLFEVPPGASSFPLHVHYANEEMLIVLAGRPTLRSVDGEPRELEPGEVVAAPIGRRGGHRIDNNSDEPVRLLVVSTMNAPDVVDYPESNKMWARSFAPGSDPGEGDHLDLLIAKGERLDYLHGEQDAD